MSLKQDWLRLHAQFDPLLPAGEAVKRVNRPYTPVPDILMGLDFPEGFRRELIVGASGAGKTTELRALQREAPDLLRVNIDLLEHFEARGDVTALDRLHAWEVLVIIGLAIYRFGTEGLRHSWMNGQAEGLKRAIAQVTDREPATVNLAGLVAELAMTVSEVGAQSVPGGPTALKLLRSAATNVSATLPLGAGRSEAALSDADPRVHGLLDAVRAMIIELFDVHRMRLLLLVDGVDRGGADVARRLFEDSALLAQLDCHVVMTAPLSLRHRNLRGWRSRFLGNVPILDPANPLVPAARIDFFRDLWITRAEAAGVTHQAIPEAELDLIAWASGGLIRQYCEMIQGVIQRAYGSGAAVDHVMVQAEIDDWRRRWEVDVDASTVSLLRQVLAARDRTGDDRERALLDQRCIVAWPNDSVWYFPHPLLLLRKVTPT